MYFSNHIAQQIFSALNTRLTLKTLQKLHSKIISLGVNDTTTRTRLAVLYISFHRIDDAKSIVESITNPCNTYLWNITIREYANRGLFSQSLKLYSKMIATNELKPDKFTYPFALKACAGLSNLTLGMSVHQQSLCCGCSSDVFVSAALVDMYSKCGEIETARLVFDQMPDRDLVSWTSMISGYAQNGCNAETLAFFSAMKGSGIRPNRVGILSVLLACANLGALQRGQWVHCYIIRAGFEFDVLVATAIIDMYAKCGSLDFAWRVFDATPGKDVACWTTMIACYGSHGRGREALGVFDDMLKAGLSPNHVTFTCVLSACSHSGLHEEGWRVFGSMVEEFGVEPKLGNYACVADLLSRAGRLEEAERLIETMPLEPDASVWGSLLGACRIHGDLVRAERIAGRVFELDPSHAGYRVLLSNIYAAKSRWGEVETVRKAMARRKERKVQGFSLVEFKNVFHKFGAGE